MHRAANRDTMAPVKLRIAAAAAVATGIAVGVARSRGSRLRVVADDGSTAPARTGPSPRRRMGKARAVLVLGTVRVRDSVGVRLGWRDGEEAADALVIEMAGDLATAINGRTSLAG